MSGFKATADPLRTSDFTVTAAIVMDPLYPYGSAVWGPSPRPREALSPSKLGRQFVPRGAGSWPGSDRHRRRDDVGPEREIRARAAVRAIADLADCRPLAALRPVTLLTDRIPLILDVDTGIDDSLALLYAGRLARGRALAVTCVGGNVDARQVERNTRAVLELAGRTTSRSRSAGERPLVRPVETTPETHGPQGLGYAELPPPTRPLSDRHAVDVCRGGRAPARRGDARDARTADEPRPSRSCASRSCRGSSGAGS